VQAHLLGAEEARHLVALDDLQRPRRQAVVDRVEDQQPARAGHQRQQVQALGAAVDQAHRRGEAPAGLQGLDTAHTETFVGPQHVADAEDDDLGRKRVPPDGDVRHGAMFVAPASSRLMPVKQP